MRRYTTWLYPSSRICSKVAFKMFCAAFFDRENTPEWVQVVKNHRLDTFSHHEILNRVYVNVVDPGPWRMNPE